ncbi:MAG: DUF1697 domain-containing protein [Acidobacteria bacterium]|nr:DUF1697 domain-containing protein [Acidobacteriota bacterium]
MRYVAFLRAINVGGRVVKMDRLREIFTGIGLQNVETLIASGNVLFSAEEAPASILEERIESAIEKALPFGSVTFLRTGREMSEITARQVFSPAEAESSHAVYAGFLKRPLTPAEAAKVEAFSGGNDEFRVAGREIHWLCRERSPKSISWPGKLEKSLKIAATFRNISTAREITARLCG